MKKIFIINLLFLLVSGLIAQEGGSGIRNGETPWNSPPSYLRNSTQTQRTTPNTGTQMDFNTASISSIFPLSMAAHYTDPYWGRSQKELAAYPELGVVVYCNVADSNIWAGNYPDSNAVIFNSQDIRYRISTDKGNTWSNSYLVGNVINPNSSIKGRYPNTPVGILFNNSDTSITDLKYHVVAGAYDTISAYQVHITEQNVSSINAYNSQEEYIPKNMGGSVLNITERVHNSGEFWAATLGNWASWAISCDTLYVLRGFYNTNTKRIDWEIKNKIERASTFHYINSRAPVIAFSPDGTKGYMADIGDIATGQNKVCQPIFWEFNGTDFSDPPFWININMPALLASYINGNATCAFDMDMTVDMYGEPHFMAVVGNAPPLGTPNYYYYIDYIYMQQIDIHRSNGSWYATPIARQSTLRDVLDLTVSNGEWIDVHPILSRSLDGKYIFYTWTDTKNGGVFNKNPDLWGRMLDVSTGLLTDSINWTINDSLWHGRARSPKTSEYVFETPSTSTCGKTFEVPTTIFLPSDSTYYLAPAQVYYVSDITYNCEDAIYPAQNLLLAIGTDIEKSAIGINHIKVYPNPAKNQLKIELKLVDADKLSLTLVNVNGQKLITKQIVNALDIKEQFDISTLASGLYFLQITTSKGTQAQKVWVE